MKKLITVIMLFWGLSVCGQDSLSHILPLIDGKVTYIGVIQVDSINKDELYKRAKKWFIDAYNSGKDVIQLDDKESGELIGKGFFKTVWMVTFYAGQEVNVWQTIKIEVKDGRYRYEITDFNMKYYVTPSQYTNGMDVDTPLETWNRTREENAKKVYVKIDEEVQSLIVSLKKFMTTKPKDDW